MVEEEINIVSGHVAQNGNQRVFSRHSWGVSQEEVQKKP
jgi:hypothetical protein